MPIVREADTIIRSCVHCGFCNAVCPTYQLLGDELDGPRGRIYLIKNLLEEDHISSRSTEHIDRCLSCRSCETTCPSGVKFGRLLDIGRQLIAERNTPGFRRRFISWVLRNFVPRRHLFHFLLSLGQLLRPILPRVLANFIPDKTRIKSYPSAPAANMDPLKKSQRVLLLQGCVQRAATPNVNNALEKLLAMQGTEFVYLDSEGCCGALDYHLSAHKNAIEKIQLQVERLFEQVGAVDHILSSASGCGVTIKQYPEILGSESDWYDRAEAVVSKVMDVSEFLMDFEFNCQDVKVAVHTPCTLQHGQKLGEAVEHILSRAGAILVEVGDKHLCCGSAGTYSILQPQIANDLTTRKVTQLTKNRPEVILTANIGCQLQLQSHTAVPVQHWVEFLADMAV